MGVNGVMCAMEKCPRCTGRAAPAPYPQRKSSRMYYRLPAFLPATDLKNSARQLLQIHFDR